MRSQSTIDNRQSAMPETLIPAVAVFARAPIAGHAKTRLIPLLGSQGAAALQAALISDTLRKVAGLQGCARPHLFWAGDSLTYGRTHAEGVFHELSCTLPHLSAFTFIRQQGKGLGERLENAFRRLLRLHPSCVVIGTDSPLFPARILRQALRELHACESVLGPCPDGGYYLIALRRPVGPEMLRGIFRGVRWSTAFAFGDTLRNVLRLGLSCSVLEECADVDLPRDLQRLKKSLSRDRTARRLAPATWRFLKGSVVRSPSSVAKTSPVTTDN
jgi:rSAM/selenodomain-associated transferase 1